MNFTRILLRQITFRSASRLLSTEVAPAATAGSASKDTNAPTADAAGKDKNMPASGKVGKSSNIPSAAATGKSSNAPAASATAKVANAPATDAARKDIVAPKAVVEKLVVPAPEGEEKPVNPKLESIVNSIAALSLLEVSELSSLLKKRLNVPETAFVTPQFAPGPAGGPAGASAEEEEVEAPKKVQTAFKVKLVKFDEKQKVALIKEIKNLLEGMNLVQAKKFVESAPTIVKEDLPKEEAEKLKEALTKAGAIIEIE
ncbi:54S ribosomal protein L12, mitochondrial [Glossina fuscipes]|uniref:54S ribosomal protein L12, mitochondrial n=1 Tax=Glossina fuscipes TaxID=7396 RepID=A0A9C5ZHQ5_9MUSC|nr:54S ribosomal protein L12, mitochondrial [Glossina fuscipes]